MSAQWKTDEHSLVQNEKKLNCLKTSKYLVYCVIFICFWIKVIDTISIETNTQELVYKPQWPVSIRSEDTI